MFLVALWYATFMLRSPLLLVQLLQEITWLMKTVARSGAAVVDLPKSQHNLATVTEVDVQGLFGGNAVVEDDLVLAWFSEFNDENGGSVLYDGSIRTQFGGNEVPIFGDEAIQGRSSISIEGINQFGNSGRKEIKVIEKKKKDRQRGYRRVK
ncbi:hypothetical protein LOK49_LG15G00987 [Camellia lanceoleosa]|uniref:Uncharacterized protein n=1 Tax=Camellia lanceoleosa TaxID=1840588 RepID=A0ACC0F7W1_9ERIC|nr:hypothetical protein LOK49_LG15G00987 [Camellia lanceoleosa]